MISQLTLRHTRRFSRFHCQNSRIDVVEIVFGQLNGAKVGERPRNLRRYNTGFGAFSVSSSHGPLRRNVWRFKITRCCFSFFAVFEWVIVFLSRSHRIDEDKPSRLALSESFSNNLDLRICRLEKHTCLQTHTSAFFQLLPICFRARRESAEGPERKIDSGRVYENNIMLWNRRVVAILFVKRAFGAESSYRMEDLFRQVQCSARTNAQKLDYFASISDSLTSDRLKDTRWS